MPESSVGDRRRAYAFAAAFGFAGVLVTWLATGPHMLALINWDAASYVANAALGRMTWSYPPWNNHFGVHTILWFGVELACALGGTVVDGFRLVEALFFGIACAVMADLVRRLTRDRLIAALLTCAWMAAWVNLFLIITLEYNILFLATGAMIVWMCVVHVDTWSWRHGIVAGALAAVGVLVSWQASLYLAPPCHVAAIFGAPDRTGRARARDAALVLVTFFAVLSGWAVLIGFVGDLTVAHSLAVLYSRPRPAALPSSAAELARLVVDVRQQTRAIGTGVAYQLAHTCYHLPAWLSDQVEAIGTVTMLLLVAVEVVVTRRALRRRRWAMHVVASALLLFTLLTSLYKDVEYAYLKRFNFLPLLSTVLAAGLYGECSKAAHHRRAVAGILAALILVEIALWVRWDRARHQWYPTLDTWMTTHPEAAWYGRDHQSWFAYYRGLRQSNPRACRFVLAFEEVAEGGWNNDITASLWSELPNHLVLGNPTLVAKWRFPPRISATDDYREKHGDERCAWISSDARHLLAHSTAPRPSPRPTR